MITRFALMSLLAMYFWIVDLLFRFFNFWFRRRRLVDTPSDELLFLSAARLTEYIRTRELTASYLIDAYIARIQHVNGALNAMILDNFSEARLEAERIDEYLEDIDINSEEYLNLPQTKPLLGIPFTVKNNIYVKGFVCTAGVPARISEPPCRQDAEAVRRLRDAGAILIGITNVPELGLWWETSNRLFGITRNPYDLRRTAGGSSGGESALLAAGASVLGLGNDVGGSLRIPPAFCGIYGLKPSPGLVPSKDVFPVITGGYVETMATAGPMCRYADDLAPFLRVLVGNDVADNVLRIDQPVDLRKIRIFYMEGINSPFCEPLHYEVREALRKVVKYFEKRYDRPTHRLDLPLAHHALQMYLTSLDEDSILHVREALTNYKSKLNPFIELAKHLVGASAHTLPAIMTALHCTLPQPNAAERGFVNSKRDQLRVELSNLLGEDGILLFPSFPTLPPYINQPLTAPFNFAYSALWSAVALPALICPIGMNRAETLPLSVQIIAAPNAERLLIACARDLEEGFGGWVVPHSHHRFF